MMKQKVLKAVPFYKRRRPKMITSDFDEEVKGTDRHGPVFPHFIGDSSTDGVQSRSSVQQSLSTQVWALHSYFWNNRIQLGSK